MSRSKNTQSMLKTRFEDLKEMEKETQSLNKILEEYKHRMDLESQSSFKNWISTKKQRKPENKINFKNSKIKILPDKRSEPSIVETPFKPFTKFPSILENERKPKTTTCGQCTLRTAILICNECFEYYCQDCFGEMHNKGNMLKHSVTSLEVFLSGTHNSHNSDKARDEDKKVPETKLVGTHTQEDQLVPESSDKSTEITIKPINIKFTSSGLTYGQRLLLQRLKQLDLSPSEKKVRNPSGNVLNSSTEEDKESDSYNMEMIEFSRSLLADPSKYMNPELTGSGGRDEVDVKTKENVILDISSIPAMESSPQHLTDDNQDPKEDLIIDTPPPPAVELSQSKGETNRRRKKSESVVKPTRRPRSNCSLKSVDCRNYERQLTQITPQIKEIEGIKHYKVSGLSNFYSLTSFDSRNFPQTTTPKLSYNFYKLSPKSWSMGRTLELEDPAEFVKYDEVQQNGDTPEDLDVTKSPKVEDPPKRLKQNNVATVSFSLSKSMDGQPNLDLFSSIDSTQISSENDSMADDECESDETVNDLEKQLEMSIENQKMNENDKFREFMYVMLDTTKSYSMSSSESSGESYGSITTVCPEDEVHSLR